jgi:hypothetical protein
MPKQVVSSPKREKLYTPERNNRRHTFFFLRIQIAIIPARILFSVRDRDSQRNPPDFAAA